MLFSHFELEDAAFSVMRNSGRLELALAGAKAYQGAIKGRVTFDLGPLALACRRRHCYSADFAALSFDAFGWPEFNGSLTGTANLESSGASMYELMHNLDGTAQIDVAQGQLGGSTSNPPCTGSTKAACPARRHSSGTDRFRSCQLQFALR